MASQGNYGRLHTLDELDLLAKTLLKHGKPVGFDVETGYYGPPRPRGALDIAWDQQFVCGFSITNDKSWARYVPLAHDLGDNLPERESWEIIQPVLETLPVYAHNFKFEKRNLRALGWKGRGPRIELMLGGDTILQEFVLSEQRALGLKDLVEAIFDHKMAHIESLFPDLAKNKHPMIRFNILELTTQVIEYACEDAAWCLALREKNEDRAKAERGFMWRLEHEIMQMMCDVEDRGMHTEWEEMTEERQRAHPFLAEMEKATKAGLSEMADRDLRLLNLNSSKQMQALLYRDLGLVTTRLTKSANEPKNADKEPWEKMSTDKEAMKALSDENPPIKKLLEFREAENAIKRFDKWLDECHYAKDDRAHPNFSQTIVASGRFAAADPPVHQMPKEWRFTTIIGKKPWKDEDWAEIVKVGQKYATYWTGNFRDYVSASPGTYLIGFDYSQIELRVMAGISREPILLDAFKRGIDVHAVTAAMMLNKPLEQVDKYLDRPVGKTMNFALLYQMGPKSLAERLGYTMEEAKEKYANYFAQFSSITTWMQDARSKGQAKGYAETFFGRKFTVWDLQSHLQGVRAKGERILINAPIQGGAADYMKIAMLRARKALETQGWWGKVMLIHNLHDALTFEADNDIDPVELREVLQKAVVFPVKDWPEIVAEWELGHRQGSMVEWKEEPVEFLDGHWQVVGGHRAEHEDEDMAEEFEDLDVVDIDASVAVPTLTPALVDLPVTPKPATTGLVSVSANGAGVEVIVTVPRMPDDDQIDRFKEMLLSHPGSNAVVLRTPQGDARFTRMSSMDIQDQGQVSMIFSGATVRRSAASVDLEALSKGLKL